MDTHAHVRATAGHNAQQSPDGRWNASVLVCLHRWLPVALLWIDWVTVRGKVADSACIFNGTFLLY